MSLESTISIVCSCLAGVAACIQIFQTMGKIRIFKCMEFWLSILQVVAILGVLLSPAEIPLLSFVIASAYIFLQVYSIRLSLAHGMVPWFGIAIFLSVSMGLAALLSMKTVIHELDKRSQDQQTTTLEGKASPEAVS